MGQIIEEFYLYNFGGLIASSDLFLTTFYSFRTKANEIQNFLGVWNKGRESISSLFLVPQTGLGCLLYRGTRVKVIVDLGDGLKLNLFYFIY